MLLWPSRPKTQGCAGHHCIMVMISGCTQPAKRRSSLRLTRLAASNSGGEHAAVLYSPIGTCRLNNVEPEKWLRYVIEHIQDWPANRVRDLLPWKADLSSQ